MKLRMHLFVLPLIFSLLCSFCIRAAASDLEVGHWAYDYLERMKVKGVVSGFLNQTRPLPRKEIATALGQVVVLARAGDPRISSVERSQLEWLQLEFAEELSEKDRAETGRDRHLVQFQDNDRGMILDLGGRLWGNLGGVDGATRRILDFRAILRARGYLGEVLSYSALVAKGQVRSNLSRVQEEDIGLTGYFESNGSYGYYDWSHAHLSLNFSWIELQLARQPVDWGPGIRGNLTLSSYPPAYDYFLIRARVKQIIFTHMHAFLLPTNSIVYYNSDGFLRRQFVDKFLAAHRVEIGLLNNLHVGLTETIIYGERNLDISYLNPLVFFWSAQHSSHDRDNETLSFDIWFQPARNFGLYTALFIDELHLKGLFANDARNKVGYLGGVQLVDPLGLSDTDVRLEYARVTPCVYTHKYPVNSYQHDGEPLGHWLEQNGDDLSVLLRHRFSRHLGLRAQFSRTRHGEPGEMPYCHGEPARYSFLQGTVDQTLNLNLGIDYEPIKDVRAVLLYQRNERENIGHVSGENETSNELSLELFIDY